MRLVVNGFLLPCFILVTLTGCLGGKDNTIPPTKLVDFQPSLRTQKVWSTSIGLGTAGQYLKLSPVIAGNTIFAASYDGQITAINRENGRRIWKTPVNVLLTSGLAVGNDLLFIGTGDGEILALRQDNGTLLWRERVSSEVLAAPTVTQDLVLVKSEDGHLFAFNNKTGKLVWNYTHQEPNLILRGSSSVEVFDGLVIAGFADGQLVALTLKEGNIVWQRAIALPQGGSAIERMVDIDVDPKVINGVVYAATYQGRIVALDLKTGHLLWQHDLSSYAGLAVGESNVYVSDAESRVWAFDHNTGAVVWKQEGLIGRYITGPSLLGDAVVVGDELGYLHWLSQIDGHFVVRERLKSGMISAPVANDRQLYVLTNDGRLSNFTLR